MILCGYRSYKKENRFKQKIENIKKEKKKTLQLTKRSNSEEKRTIVFSNEGCSDQHQQMMNPIINNEQQPTMKENEKYEQQIILENMYVNVVCIPSDEDSEEARGEQ